jgi:hypothetical protein
LGDLIPWGDNPKYSTKEDAKRLIETEQEFGQPQTFSVSPYLDGSKVNCYDGHQRDSAWRTAYGDDFQVWAMQSDRHLTEAERKRFVLRMHNAHGQWSSDVLSGWGADELTQGWFNSATLKTWKADVNWLDKFLQSEQAGGADAEPQTDRAAELLEVWGCKTGDLWQLGDNRLLIGDCTIAENVSRLMDGEKAGVVFTDPPYGVGKEIENDDLSGGDFDAFNAAWIRVMETESNCGFVCYHSTRTFPSVLIAAKDLGWKFERMLWYYVPDKFPAHSWKHWLMVSQAIMLFSLGDVVYADTESDQDCYKLTAADLGNGHGHPTEKREGHCRRVMSHYSGELVYEPFAGSGTTIIAAQNLSRRCYAMEISEKYAAVILQRFADAFPALLIRRLDAGG